jgi:hypothetical protein
LRKAAYEFRHAESAELLARRMGVEVGDRKHLMVSAIFSSVIVTACGDLVSDTDAVRLGAGVMADRLDESFAQLAVLAADLPRPADEMMSVHG